ncbi:MAG: hypothetical protein HY825_13905 [Acidobacteria bacterium]|nr:hypothetical protein [Acidobacteriota bacterium]
MTHTRSRAPRKLRGPLLASAVILAVLLPAAPAGAEATAYTDEATYLAALTAAGYDQFTEGFEGAAWAGVRTANPISPVTAASVTSQGIAWSGSDGITTNNWAARSGWALYDEPGGDPDVLRGWSESTLVALGGWFKTSTGTTTLRIRVDGAPVDSGSLALGSTYAFLGVIDPDGFTSFEIFDSEASPQGPRHWFCDDFTFARGVGAGTPVMTGVVPGVAAVGGFSGSDWHSDLFLHNASAQDLAVDLYFSPRGGTVDPGQVRTRTVAPGQTLTVPDVVASLFGTTGSGAIHWRVTAGDSTRLLVSANTYNRIDASRRYGQQVAGQRWNPAAPAGTPQVVPAVAGRYRTNLGFATDRRCTRVLIRGLDRAGNLKAERSIDVPPLTFWQLDDLFRLAFPGLLPDPGTASFEESLHRFEVTGIDGRVVASTSVIDNTSNDGCQFPAQWGPAAERILWLPSAALIDGLNNSHWQSDLILFNVSERHLAPALAYFPSGRDNADVQPSLTLQLPAANAIASENALLGALLLTPPTKGSIRVDATESGALLGWMRTYSTEAGPASAGMTYGQAISPLSGAGEVVPGIEGRIYGFSQGDVARSNLILQNTRGSAGGSLLPAAVTVELLESEGTALAGRTYQLRPGEYLQVDQFAESLGVASIDGGSLRVTLADDGITWATGGVAAYVSEVNGNSIPGTNDGRLLATETVAAPGT